MLYPELIPYPAEKPNQLEGVEIKMEFGIDPKHRRWKSPEEMEILDRRFRNAIIKSQVGTGRYKIPEYKSLATEEWLRRKSIELGFSV